MPPRDGGGRPWRRAGDRRTGRAQHGAGGRRRRPHHRPELRDAGDARRPRAPRPRRLRRGGGRRSRRCAVTGALVTFGVVPTHPATGYGYIRVAPGSTGLSPVAEFVEKPDLPDAERFATDGEHLWNSGMFMFTAERYLEELARFEPDVAAAASAAVATAAHRRRRVTGPRRGDAFSRSPSISIDYAVMERTRSAVVVPLDAGWSDVGSWASLDGRRGAGRQRQRHRRRRGGRGRRRQLPASRRRAARRGRVVRRGGGDDPGCGPGGGQGPRRGRQAAGRAPPPAAPHRGRPGRRQPPEPWGTSEILARIGDGVVTACTRSGLGPPPTSKAASAWWSRAPRCPEGSDCQPAP